MTLDDMLSMQRALQAQYAGQWEPICPDTGKNKLLWMLGEAGEVIDIIKKHGDEAACTDPALRAHLTEELADVLMYFGDVLLCYGITADELSAAYRQKFQRNMTRWKENEE